jgi:hypothetical protein
MFFALLNPRILSPAPLVHDVAQRRRALLRVARQAGAADRLLHLLGPEHLRHAHHHLPGPLQDAISYFAGLSLCLSLPWEFKILRNFPVSLPDSLYWQGHTAGVEQGKGVPGFPCPRRSSL